MRAIDAILRHAKRSSAVLNSSMLWKRLALSTAMAFMIRSDRPGRQFGIEFLRRAGLALHMLVHHCHVIAARVRRHAG